MKIIKYPKDTRALCPSCNTEFVVEKSDFKKNKVAFHKGNLVCTCPICGKVFSPFNTPVDELWGKVNYHFQEVADKVKAMAKDENRKVYQLMFADLYDAVLTEFEAYSVGGDDDEEDD